jgi:hypothetical protein
MELLSLLRFNRPGGLNPVVRELLERATDTRSAMAVEFTHPDLAGRRFSGPCAEFDEHTVLLDLSLGQNDLSAWTGETALVGFVLDNKGASSYYQFVSCLRGLPRCGGGLGMLLDTPAEIVLNQKRGFVRLSPRKEVIFGVGIWPLQPGQACPGQPASLGVARASYRQDHQQQLALLNVSAAGLCLKLRRAQANQPAMDPLAGDRLLCLLVLGSQTGEQTLSLWLDCTVANCGDKAGASYSIVGLSFDAWAAPSRDESAVSWFPVQKGGAIAPLAAWVLRQQIAQAPQSAAR